MLAKGEKNITFSAMSMIDVDEKNNTGIPIASMYGIVNLAENKISTNDTVLNAELYNKHYDEAEKDYTDFRRWVRDEWSRLAGESEGGE